MTIVNMVGSGGETTESLCTHYMTTHGANTGSYAGSFTNPTDYEHAWYTSGTYPEKPIMNYINGIYYGSPKGAPGGYSTLKCNWAKINRGTNVYVGNLDGSPLPVGTKVTGLLMGSYEPRMPFVIGGRYNTIAKFTVSYASSSSISRPYSYGPLESDTYYPVVDGASIYTYSLYPIRIELPE